MRERAQRVAPLCEQLSPTLTSTAPAERSESQMRNEKLHHASVNNAMHSSWTTHNDWTCGMQFRFFADFQFRIGAPQLPLVNRVRSLLTAAAAAMWNRSQMNECANETWIERIIAILCLFPFERSVVFDPSTFFDLEWFSLFYVADRLLNNKIPSNIPASIDTRDHFSIRVSIKSFPHHTISVWGNWKFRFVACSTLYL